MILSYILNSTILITLAVGIFSNIDYLLFKSGFQELSFRQITQNILKEERKNVTLIYRNKVVHIKSCKKFHRASGNGHSFEIEL